MSRHDKRYRSEDMSPIARIKQIFVKHNTKWKIQIFPTGQSGFENHIKSCLRDPVLHGEELKQSKASTYIQRTWK